MYNYTLYTPGRVYIDKIEKNALHSTKVSRDTSWKNYRKSIDDDLNDAMVIITRVAQNSPKNKKEIIDVRDQLSNTLHPLKSDILYFLF